MKAYKVSIFSFITWQVCLKYVEFDSSARMAATAFVEKKTLIKSRETDWNTTRRARWPSSYERHSLILQDAQWKNLCKALYSIEDKTWLNEGPADLRWVLPVYESVMNQGMVRLLALIIHWFTMLCHHYFQIEELWEFTMRGYHQWKQLVCHNQSCAKPIKALSVLLQSILISSNISPAFLQASSIRMPNICALHFIEQVRAVPQLIEKTALQSRILFTRTRRNQLWLTWSFYSQDVRYSYWV